MQITASQIINHHCRPVSLDDSRSKFINQEPPAIINIMHRHIVIVPGRHCVPKTIEPYQ